jgi:DNA replication and repair protein RecF
MITDIRLQNFRSYKDAAFELNPGVNIVVGPNASGKTNLLEAVLVLARGSSYRARDQELIRFKQPWARLDSLGDNNEARTVKIVARPEPAKQYEITGKTYKRLTVSHTLPSVLFEPGHLQLLTGGPERRRDYLDELLEQAEPGYATLRRQYRRALAQRNHLLKHPKAAVNQFFPWNVRLSQLAGQIVRARSGLIDKINSRLPALYKDLSKAKTSVTLVYEPHWTSESYETRFLKQLEGGLDDDKNRGFTTQGPHREDLAALFDGRRAQEIASRGETRTAILALKIIELQLLEATRNQTPLLLLDDVFSELDGRRRRALTDYLAPYQSFITTTDADIVTKHFTNKTNIILVAG